jgi:hypothetical protein
MARVIGMNRAGSVWITPTDAALLGRHDLWYRVDFRAEFGDDLRDGAHRLLRGAGVRFLPILLWDRGRPRDATWAEWDAYVRHVVGRYRDQRYWQLWNEPNNGRVPKTYFGNDLDGWRGFLRHTAHVVKQANPQAMVVAGGIAVGGHGSKRIRDFPTGWFKVHERVDRVAIHTYCGDADEAAKAINQARRVADQAVWVTELGRKSTVDGPRRQAQWYRRVRDLTGSVPLFWFDLQDVDGAFDGFGALRRDRSRKPVWRSLTG